MRALGVDLGTRRIGVAVSAGMVATPYEVVERSGDRRADHARLADLATDVGAALVVVGLPLSMDGTIGRAARKAQIEAEQLAGSFDVPVETWDERLSTVSAHRALGDAGLDERRRRQIVDKVAAAVILQSWLDAHPDTVSEPSTTDQERV